MASETTDCPMCMESGCSGVPDAAFFHPALRSFLASCLKLGPEDIACPACESMLLRVSAHWIFERIMGCDPREIPAPAREMLLTLMGFGSSLSSDAPATVEGESSEGVG